MSVYVCMKSNSVRDSCNARERENVFMECLLPFAYYFLCTGKTLTEWELLVNKMHFLRCYYNIVFICKKHKIQCLLAWANKLKRIFLSMTVNHIKFDATRSYARFPFSWGKRGLFEIWRHSLLLKCFIVSRPQSSASTIPSLYFVF